MRIFLEAGPNGLCNAGDIAMLQVAVQKLRRVFPGAEITVATLAIDHLAAHCGGVTAIANGQRWRMTPDFVVRRGFQKLRAVAGFTPGRDALLHLGRPCSSHFLEAVRSADLVAFVGGGNLTTVFTFGAQFFLQTLRLAAEFGKPTVMFGQGVGPITAGSLRQAARAILPHAHMIAVRERLTGPALLGDLGVPRERIIVTGDDAVELAYAARPASLGSTLGVNVRLSDYSGVGTRDLPMIREALRHAAVRRGVELVPVPINWGIDPDMPSIRRLLRGMAAEPVMRDHPCSSTSAIARIGCCRAVVTGSYHAGVFALSQGIPAVCLARSVYYADKFNGLRDMFGAGCEVVSMDDPEFTNVLAAAIERALTEADSFRSPLHEAARRQIAAAEDACARIPAMLR